MDEEANRTQDLPWMKQLTGICSWMPKSYGLKICMDGEVGKKERTTAFQFSKISALDGTLQSKQTDHNGMKISENPVSCTKVQPKAVDFFGDEAGFRDALEVHDISHLDCHWKKI